MVDDSFYTSGVEWDLLKTFGIKVIMHQPWQIGLMHDELKGKFLWYPKTGTLMFQNVETKKGYRIGYQGDFKAGGFPDDIENGFDPYVTEKVCEEIKRKIKTQQDNELG